MIKLQAEVARLMDTIKKIADAESWHQVIELTGDALHDESTRRK